MRFSSHDPQDGCQYPKLSLVDLDGPSRMMFPTGKPGEMGHTDDDSWSHAPSLALGMESPRSTQFIRGGSVISPQEIGDVIKKGKGKMERY